VWDQIQRQRLTGMGQFTRHLHASGHLPSGTTVEEACDMLWTFTSPELRNPLLIQRGWTPARYGHWLVGMLTAALFTYSRREDGT
jgi:hypothetical protein